MLLLLSLGACGLWMGKGANSLGTEVTRDRHRVHKGSDHHIFRVPEPGSGIRALCGFAFNLLLIRENGIMLAGERASLSARFWASFLEFSVLYLDYARAVIRTLNNNTLILFTLLHSSNKFVFESVNLRRNGDASERRSLSVAVSRFLLAWQPTPCLVQSSTQPLNRLQAVTVYHFT